MRTLRGIGCFFFFFLARTATQGVQSWKVLGGPQLQLHWSGRVFFSFWALSIFAGGGAAKYNIVFNVPRVEMATLPFLLWSSKGRIRFQESARKGLDEGPFNWRAQELCLRGAGQPHHR